MPRPKFVASTENPYLVTSRCINKEWFSLPMENVWRIMCDYLFLTRSAFEIKIFAFVLMNNHFHMLIGSPKGNLSKAIQYFKRETSRVINFESRRINQMWAGRFHRCEIAGTHHYLNAYKYLYRNPVAVNLVEKVQDYQFSSLNGLLGGNRLDIPLEDDSTLFWDVEGTLSWLNRPTSKENMEAVRKALRRCHFQLPKSDSRPHHLENNLL